MAVLFGLAGFVIFVGLATFLWFWWAAPRDQVPPHFTETDLRRLEVQDRLRQTNYQVLTAIALGATFLATMIQFGTTTQQWTADFELRSAQERLTQYTEAIKTVSKDSSLTTKIAGVTTLQLLGVQDPKRFHRQASEVLTQFIADHQAENMMTRSLQCEDRLISTEGLRDDRDEAPTVLKVAMKAVGHPQFAASRLNFTTDKCAPEKQSVDRGPLWLEHMKLDNLDLSGRDFSCAKMSQSHFHRSSFYGASLSGADLRGVQLGDFSTPGFPANTIKNKLYKAERDGGPLEWQRYRCWVTDFRYAKLRDANFEGAVLSGADFRDADLSGVNFCRADISRANFSNAKGLTSKMLADACVGKAIDPSNPATNPELAVIEDAQPFGIDVFGKDFRVKRCLSTKSCDR
ncbi:pentapeptide repeat-containing protein [Bradyrhizobium sp. 170]|uniref:pentapeptide repeat-containing protein n=1 Tax=Bradyrhizobium sp. 170 TaxID=2782641 RepID=UPI00200018BE|nr:pentapeptide repeat-containing protein [Bradyrhizobium sp. 170]UPK01813.1 pentapeptide repeat-containing protein [Bradyrhizobium sp. 170]